MTVFRVVHFRSIGNEEKLLLFSPPAVHLVSYVTGGLTSLFKQISKRRRSIKMVLTYSVMFVKICTDFLEHKGTV
jgi:hypothetical protein